MQAEWLDELAGSGHSHDQPGQANDQRAIADAHAVLERATREAVAVGGWSSAEPLRLHKSRIVWLLHCPRRAVATDDASAMGSGNVVIGLLIDAAAKLATLGATRPVTVDGALAFLDALGEVQVREHLSDIGQRAANALMAEAEVRLGQLMAVWPTIDPEWWPRIEEPVRVPLAGGAVTLGGRLDVLLGGPPTDRPSVVIEIKGGRWHDSVRGDAHFYALLLGLRDGVPPATVTTIAAGDGATQVEPIRPAVLRHTAERVAAALESAARLAAGEAPQARPGIYCSSCPVRPGCPAQSSDEAA